MSAMALQTRVSELAVVAQCAFLKSMLNTKTTRYYKKI